MLIEPLAVGKVVVALQDGFYGASSGSGFSNRDFLIALTRLLPPERLVVVSVRGYSDPIDPCWAAALLRSLRRADAQTVLINHCRDDPAHGRELLAEMVTRVASGADRCLVVGLDGSLLGLTVDDTMDLLLVPRSTAALTCADLSEIIWERDCLHTAVKSGGHVATISEYMRQHLRDDYGLPDDALVGMHNGLLLDGEPSENAIPLPGPAEEVFSSLLGGLFRTKVSKTCWPLWKSCAAAAYPFLTWSWRRPRKVHPPRTSVTWRESSRTETWTPL